jgi:hypothetical protein
VVKQVGLGFVPLVYTEAVWKTLRRNMNSKPIAVDIWFNLWI